MVFQHIKNGSTCQLTGKLNQVIKPPPLQLIPAIIQPFECLLIDCVRPLLCARSGSQYLLMCQSTRYPATFPLCAITARTAMKALTQFILVFVSPGLFIVIRDLFFCQLLAQVLKLLGVGHCLIMH